MAWHPFRNFGLKAAALALGTLLWFTVSGERVERTMRVPIASRNLPAGLEITEQPTEVEVRVRGASTEITSLQPTQLSVVADLAASEPGEVVVILEPDDVRAPLGVDVMQVEPGSVQFKLEKSDSAVVPVRATIEGQPAPGYVVREVIVEPRNVRVVGPASRLRSTTFAVTERVSVQDLTETVIQPSVGVAPQDARLRVQDTRAVRVTVRIEPASAERTFSGRLIAFRNLPAGRSAMVEPTTVAVTVQGRAATLPDLSEAAIQPYVDLAGLGPGRHELPVNISLPLGHTLVAIRPATVSVRVR